MKSNNVFDLAIIGSGISGLTAGYWAKKHSKNFIIIDPNPKPGGCILSKNIDDTIIECGANTLASNKNLETILDEINLKSEVVFPSIPKFKQYIWDIKDKKPKPIPKSLISFIFGNFFTFKEKILVIAGLFKKVSTDNDVTVGQLFSTLFSKDVVAKSIQPALRGIFGADCDQILARKTFPRIYDSLAEKNSLFTYITKKKQKRKIFCLKNGNQSLCLALKNYLSLDNSLNNSFLLEPVTKVSFDNRYIINTPNHELFSKKLVVCTSGTTTAQFLSFLVPQISNKLNKLKYAPIVAMHLIVEKKFQYLPQGFGMLFPFEEKAKIIGILCNSFLFPHVSKACNLITVCLGGQYQEHLLSMTNKELEEIALKELKKYLSIDQAKVINVHRWEKAIPIFDRSTGDLDAFLDSLEKEYPGLIFCGVDRGYIGVPDRIDYVLEKLNFYS